MFRIVQSLGVGETIKMTYGSSSLDMRPHIHVVVDWMLSSSQTSVAWNAVKGNTFGLGNMPKSS